MQAFYNLFFFFNFIFKFFSLIFNKLGQKLKIFSQKVLQIQNFVVSLHRETNQSNNN